MEIFFISNPLLYRSWSMCQSNQEKCKNFDSLDMKFLEMQEVVDVLVLDAAVVVFLEFLAVNLISKLRKRQDLSFKSFFFSRLLSRLISNKNQRHSKHLSQAQLMFRKEFLQEMCHQTLSLEEI
jgi:hypothetical protein